MGMFYGHNKELPLTDTLRGEYGLLYNINAGGGTLTLTGTANSTDMLSYTYTNSILYITYGTNYT